MYYVHASYSKGTSAIGRAVRYIAHREERLPEGRTRELYGIGERYRALRGDEPAIVRQFTKDGAELKEPRYYRIKLTVDDRAAERLARLGPARLETALHDAVERTFRGALRGAQGVYVVHENERGKRPFGNPHVHVFLSPLADDEKTYYVSKKRLATFKKRWEHEVGRTLERRDRSARGGRTDAARLSERLVRSVGQVARGRGGGVARSLPGVAGRVGRLPRDVVEAATAPDQLALRIAFDLLSRFMPAPLRPAAEVVRRLGPVIPRG